MKKQEKNKLTEAHRATKRIGVIVLLIFFTLFLVGNVSAFEFDNVGNYDEETQTIEIRNSVLGIPFLQLSKVAEIKLNTPNTNVLPIGYQQVAEFTITNYDDYSSVLKEIEFYNMNDNMKEIERDFDYMIWTNINIEVNDYEFVCAGCPMKITGTHIEQIKGWKLLEEDDFLKGEVATIGIFTRVYMFDKVEWIPTYYGVKIDEWASYVQSSGTQTFADFGGLNYTILTFTSNGSFNVTGDHLNVSVLIIASGGGGSSGGGGAGGLIYNITYLAFGNINISVGLGGKGNNSATRGQDSSFGTLTATRGGKAGGVGSVGESGGSGAGSGANKLHIAFGIPEQGYNGSSGAGTPYPAGAGGGANESAVNATGAISSDGADGRMIDINGTDTCYAGGAPGGSYNSTITSGTGTCGAGDGGLDDACTPSINGTGAGGAGGGALSHGCDGANGIVIVRYLTSDTIDLPTTNLISPVNNTNLTITSETFSCNATDNEGLTNISLEIDGVTNFTNSTGFYYFEYSAVTNHIEVSNDASLNFGATTDFSISAWIKTTTIDWGMILDKGSLTAAQQYYGLMIDESNQKIRLRLDDGTTDNSIYSTNVVNDGVWHFVVATADRDGNAIVYVDGLAGTPESIATIGDLDEPTKSLKIGSSSWIAGNYNFSGSIDEPRIYNKSLSPAEVTSLYNQEREEITGSVAIPNLVSYWNLGSNAVIDNKGSNDGTNTGATPTINLTKEVNGLIEGDHWWTCTAFDNENQSMTASNRTFGVDITYPVINITDPINGSTNITSYITEDNATIDLKWTTIDLNLDKCWYYNSTHNNTITCDDNATIYLPYNQYTFYIYANDSFGNEVAEAITAIWNYSVMENSLTYNSETYETNNETLEVNLSYYDEDWGAVAVNLVYNGTAHTATKYSSNNFLIFNTTIDIPDLSGTIAENKSFYWNVRLTNNTGTFPHNSSEYNQSVSPLILQVCGGNINETILNFTAWHEENITRLIPFDFYGTFKFWVGDGTQQKNISISNVSVNHVDICIDNSSLTYYTDAHIQYEKLTNVSFVKRTFYILNDTLKTTIFENISLFLLPNSISQSFIIEILDDVQLPISDAYIHIQRYYPGDDTFRVVEMGRTDVTGSTMGHFEAETEDYRIIVEKDGIIIYQSGSQKIFCEEIPCKLSFQTEAGASISWTDIGIIDLFDWDMEYDETTEIWTFNYTDTSGNIGYGRLYVYYDDPIEGEVMICNESSSSLAATLTCDVTGYNGTIYASAYLSRSPEILVTLKSIVISALKAIFGLEGLFLSLFVLMVLAFAGLWNPAVGIILVVVGMIVLNITGLAVFGATAIWGIIFIALLILWNLKT